MCFSIYKQLKTLIAFSAYTQLQSTAPDKTNEVVKIYHACTTMQVQSTVVELRPTVWSQAGNYDQRPQTSTFLFQASQIHS